MFFFFFSSRRRHTRFDCDWSSDVCSSDLAAPPRQRAARAIEVALLSGRTLSWWQREARETGIMRPWYIHLTLPRDALHRRIAERVDRMLAAGLVAEGRTLLARGVAAHAPGLDGVGYREGVATLERRPPGGPPRGAAVAAARRGAERAGEGVWHQHR